MFIKYMRRLVFMDYKDARWTTPAGDVVLPNGMVYKKDSSSAKFFESIYDLGDGVIDFPACHRVLKQINYRGWICVDLDRTRQGPRTSYERCGCEVNMRTSCLFLLVTLSPLRPSHNCATASCSRAIMCD
jgi:sugar phosphate isomerase/epimerase